MEDYKILGKRVEPVDGPLKVTGGARYTADIVLPGMLYGKILRSPFSHARILNIDTAKAKGLPGVRAVLTAKEIGRVPYGFMTPFGYPDDECLLAVDKVRFIGDEVAAVAAVDEDRAMEALDLIRVDYEELPAVFDPERAMRADAPMIHEEGNINARTSVSNGDPERGLKEADEVFFDRFEIGATIHAAMEPHAAVVSYGPDGNLDVWAGSMGIFSKRSEFAKTLGIPETMVRIHKTYVGGGFGGKIHAYRFETLAGLLSMRIGRPVKIVLDREEVFASTWQGFPIIVELKTAVKRDGTLWAQDFRLIADSGGYRGCGPLCVFLCYQWHSSVYRIPHLKYEGCSVYTNQPVRGPLRGFGHPQVRFAVDSQLDRIASELGIDPIEIRLKNVRRVGEVLPNGDVLQSSGLEECIQKAASAAGWNEKRGKVKNHGIGISVGSGPSGAAVYPFGSAAEVRINEDGKVTLFTGVVEIGTGAETMLAQIVAEGLSVSLKDVRVLSGDTDRVPMDIGQFIGATTYSAGKAVAQAAREARDKLCEAAAGILEANKQDLGISDGRIFVKGSPHRGLTFSETVFAAMAGGFGPILGKGYSKVMEGTDCYPDVRTGKGRYSPAYGYAAVVAEIEVEAESGKVKILGLTSSHDCGFAINPLGVEGQVEGQLSMGVGQAFEGVQWEKGKILNPSFLGYPLPTSLDLPGMQAILVEAADPGGAYGAKEAGEATIVGVSAAIAAAIYDAVGVRIRKLPITPEEILQGIESHKSEFLSKKGGKNV